MLPDVKSVSKPVGPLSVFWPGWYHAFEFLSQLSDLAKRILNASSFPFLTHNNMQKTTLVWFYEIIYWHIPIGTYLLWPNIDIHDDRTSTSGFEGSLEYLGPFFLSINGSPSSGTPTDVIVWHIYVEVRWYI